jgi:four helix bundle protein
MHDFRKLIVWQQARSLGADVYRITRAFPREDRQIIASQLRRSALSIATNIAEGCGKESRKETVRYLQIASGSAAETEHHLMVAADVGYIAHREQAELTGRAVAIQRMLHSLIRNLPA